MTIFQTEIDDNLERYLLSKSQTDIRILDGIFNAANNFDEPQMSISKLQAVALQFLVRIIAPQRIIEVGTFLGYSSFCMAQAMSSFKAAEKTALYTIEINEDYYKKAEDNFRDFLDVFKTIKEDKSKIINDAEETRKAKIRERKESAHKRYSGSKLNIYEVMMEFIDSQDEFYLGGIENINMIYDDAKNFLGKMDKDDAKKIDLFFLDGDKENYEFYLGWVIENLRPGGYFVVDNILFKGGVLKNTGRYAPHIRNLTDALKESRLFDYFFHPVGDCMMLARKLLPKNEAKPFVQCNSKRPFHYEIYETVKPAEVCQLLNFNLGNVFKYACRAPFKGGVEDINKGINYLLAEKQRNNGVIHFENEQAEKTIQLIAKFQQQLHTQKNLPELFACHFSHFLDHFKDSISKKCLSSDICIALEELKKALLP